MLPTVEIWIQALIQRKKVQSVAVSTIRSSAATHLQKCYRIIVYVDLG